MSEPDFNETLSGPKGFTPDFAAALIQAQSLSNDEAEAIMLAAIIIDYGEDAIMYADDEMGGLKELLECRKSDGPTEVINSVKVVEALWLCAKGDKKIMKGFKDVAFIEPEIRDSKRETKLVLTSNPSYYDETLKVFMLSGAGEAAGFDDLDSLDLDAGKSLLSEIKQQFGIVSSSPEI